MSGSTSVVLRLSLGGNAGAGLRRLTQEQMDAQRRLIESLRRQGDLTRTNHATRELGMRTEAQIRAEVERVNRAYQDLRRSGTASQNDLRRGAQQLGERLRLLNAELQGGSRHTRQMRDDLAAAERSGRGLGGALGKLGAIAGGFMAAKAVLGTPLERARSFETKIFDASTSITGGYAGLSSKQVEASNLTLAGYAKAAVREGHGSVEGVGDAVGILAASGLYKKIDELKEPLKAIAKTSFSAGAQEQDVAELTKQIRQFEIMPERTQAALDRATASGFLGGFELKDMARFLPEVLPYAKTAGYSGEQGLNQVTTHMQLARKYTGLPSQAADNMRDLYNLFQQHHFSLSIGKYIKPENGDPIKKIGLRGNRMGFDINRYLANQKLEGVDTVTAVVKLMNRQLSKNPRFVALQKEIAQAEKTGNGDKATTLKKEAAQIVAGGEFGKIFHNQQSLSGLMSIIAGLNNGEFDRISKGSWEGVGSVERVATEKSKIEPAQAHALEQETILATIKVYDSVKKTLGEFEGGLKDTMAANQALAASALAAAGALAVFAGVKMGGAVLGGAAAGGAGLGVGAAVAGLGTAGLGLARMGVGALAGAGAVGGAAIAGGTLLAGGVGYGAGTLARAGYMQTEAGQRFDNGLGQGITEVLAAFGVDSAKESLELARKYEAAVEKQTRELKSALQALGTNRTNSDLSPNMMLSFGDSMQQQANRGVPYR